MQPTDTWSIWTAIGHSFADSMDRYGSAREIPSGKWFEHVELVNGIREATARELNGLANGLGSSWSFEFDTRSALVANLEELGPYITRLIPAASTSLTESFMR